MTPMAPQTQYDDHDAEYDDEHGEDDDHDEDRDHDGHGGHDGQGHHGTGGGSRGGRDHDREQWEDGAAPDDSTVLDYQRHDAEALFLSGTPCGDPNCQNRRNDAEEPWIKLVSAIPVVGQAQMLTVVTKGTPAPSQEDIRSLVAEVRPDDPDRYALRAVSAHWQDFKAAFDTDPSTGIAPILRTGLRALADHWRGDDFDAFAEQVEVVIANCTAVSDDIGDTGTGAVGLLEQKADEFYGLQGGDSGELPYPAPLYWICDTASMFTDPLVHVRPPFTSGDCQITAGCDNDGGLIGALLELGGFEKDYVDEVQDYVENQTEYYLNKHQNDDPPITEEQARAWAQADANSNITADVNAGIEDYNDRSQIANEDVVNRWQNAEESASTFTPEAEPSYDSTFRSSSDIFAEGYGGLETGTDALEAGGSPPGGGSGGLEPPGGPAGGLASGGASASTLGSGGSFPVGPASATGDGAAGNTAAGRGGMGMMGGGAGARGMGAGSEAEGDHKDWLQEDEEVWGIIRDPDDDPYA